MWCKTDGEKEDRGPDGDVGIEGHRDGVRWYGHVLRRGDGHVLRKVLEFEVKGKSKLARPKKTWKTKKEKESKSVRLEKKDAMNRAKWRVGVRVVADKVG